MINLIMAGVGGQGINSLAKVLAETCIAANHECQFTIHKGGAQSLGSVYAEFRISSETLPILGQGIPTGQLDFLIALDPWEALRHAQLAHQKTQLWVEKETMPFFMQREKSNESLNQNLNEKLAAEEPVNSVIAELNNSGLSVQWRNYREQAQQHTGTVKMANYFAGIDCIKALKLSDKSLFDTLFFQLVKKAKRF